MSVAHFLPHARFALKPLSATSLGEKAAEIRNKAFSFVQTPTPSGDVLVSVAFGAIAIYGAAMVVSLLTL